MKRSEALKLIRKELLGHYVDSNKFEEQILNTVEKIGMMPPSITAEEFRGKDWRWGGGCSMRCNCDECEPTFKIYKWSKE